MNLGVISTGILSLLIQLSKKRNLVSYSLVCVIIDIVSKYRYERYLPNIDCYDIVLIL